MPNIEEISKIVASVVAIGGLIVGIRKWLEDRRKRNRIRQLPAGDFPFEVIKPRSPDVVKQVMGGDENNPLADCKIPYQERQPDRSVRKELEDAFAEKNWVLILGKSGLGKTREAAHLANLLNQEGWTILKLVDQPGEWLDVPKEFPSEIRPDDKLLFFLDDLNRWMEPGNPREIHPKAAEELARPIREPVQERLEQLLRYFETQCRSGYVRVIATARDEREPDKPGYIAPWDKLQWEKYKSFWQQFYRYELVEPSEGAIVELLRECVEVAGLQGVPEEYEQIARRNDGTFRNITLNLESAQSRGLAVNVQEFSPKLDETWRQKYNRVVRLYPLAVYAYDAVELLRNLNLALTVPMLEAVTKRLLPGRGVRKWWQKWQLRQLLDYLATTERILEPKDGQIEAKKTGAVDVERYLPTILKQLRKMAKQLPDFAAAECFASACALHRLERYEGAINSHDEVLKIKPDEHQAWNNRGIALFALGRNEEAIVSFERALKIKSDKHHAWNNQGVALSALGRDEEAIVSFERALKIKPDNDSAWHNRGNALDALGRCEEAIVSYGEALKLKPYYYDTWYSLGRVLNALGRYEEAINSYEIALKLKPDDSLIWENRGRALSALGRYEEAIDSYDKALELKPDDDAVWKNRGTTLSALGCYKEAIISYDKALELKPDDHQAWYNRGIALSNLGFKEDAIASYDRALKLRPNNDAAWNNRGTALSALGRYEEAINSYEKVLQLKPDNYIAWYNKACCYGLQKNFDLAIASLQRAIFLASECRELAKIETDFDLIRQDDRFQALLNSD